MGASVASGTIRAGYLPSLDGLRAVAIVIVVLGHASLPSPLKGSTGVTLFFFLSGYLITTLLRVEGDRKGCISIRDFYLRRVFRIMPPLYAALLVAIVLVLVGVTASGMTVAGAISSGTFWSNYYIIGAARTGIPAGTNQLWSLAVEEHYYLLFPLLYVAMRRWLPRRLHQCIVLVAICIALMAWRVVLFREGAGFDRLYLATDTRADAILWGAVLAVGLNPIYDEVRVPQRRWLMSVVLLAGVVVFWVTSKTPDFFGMTFGYTIQSLSLFAVFVPLLTVPRSIIGRILNWRPIAFLGVLSFSLYLIHRLALELAETYLPGPHVLRVGIAIVAAVAVAYLMHIAIERPFAVLRKRISHAGESMDQTGAS